MEVETPETGRARLLAGVYLQLVAEADLEGEDRLSALFAVEYAVSSHVK